MCVFDRKYVFFVIKNTQINVNMMIIYVKKSLILINNQKKKSPAARTLPGESLSGEQVIDGPLRGGLMARKNP